MVSVHVPTETEIETAAVETVTATAFGGLRSVNFVRLDFRHVNLHTRALPDDAATWAHLGAFGIVIKFGCDMSGGLGQVLLLVLRVMWDVG